MRTVVLVGQPCRPAGLKAMEASLASAGFVARATSRDLSAVPRHTHFRDSRHMTRSLAHSDCAFEDLRGHRASVLLAPPPKWLGTHARWLRLLRAPAASPP